MFRPKRSPPMKLLRYGLIALFALLAALFALASLKSSTWSAEGVLVIEAAPEKVLPFVAGPRHWLEWDLWTDPTEAGFEPRFEGPESGAGARLSWKTDQKHGELEILGASAAEGVRYRLDLDDMPGGGEFRFEPYGDQTRVRWKYSGDLGWNLAARFFIPLMQGSLQSTMQKGLARLRERVRGG
jgi:carbon monoxide dehydrogenase subunit G